MSGYALAIFGNVWFAIIHQTDNPIRINPVCDEHIYKKCLKLKLIIIPSAVGILG